MHWRAVFTSSGAARGDDSTAMDVNVSWPSYMYTSSSRGCHIPTTQGRTEARLTAMIEMEWKRASVEFVSAQSHITSVKMDLTRKGLIT
jgi:hypothetical protein